MSGLFHFKHFSVDDSNCAMKTGVDAVLIGAWADMRYVKNALDVGTGSGIIALMLAQKSNALIDAVEIDKDASDQAIINIAKSPWSKRIQIHHLSFKDFALFSKSKYDLIVSNPPFFINSQKPSLINRSIARHNFVLSHHDLITSTLLLLHPGGRLCLILPFNEGLLFKSEAEKNHLYCNKITYVKPTASKSPHRLLMELSLFNSKIAENELTIEDGGRHQFSAAYKKLTRDFYPAF